MEGPEEVVEQKDEEEVECVVVEDGECGRLSVSHLVPLPRDPVCVCVCVYGGGEYRVKVNVELLMMYSHACVPLILLHFGELLSSIAQFSHYLFGHSCITLQ